ncbi:hypothetical protein FPQ18DRAFT_372908 [Pyronema domesticum]|nr:hypothetical protein FPQ18DRAFT_372908 [Pyronema domesticum]
MSSNLWRYYLENDAERFQRLLSGASLSHRGQGQKSSGNAGLTTPTGSYKTPSHVHHANREKNKHDGLQNTQLTAKQLREMDILGRTVLHRACTDQGRLEFVIALLQHPQTDPAITDLESGWTALHRALYHGNISAAREIMSAAPGNWSLVKLKDHAGDSPWEVFESTVQEIHEPIKKRTTLRRNSDSSSEHDDDEEADDIPSEDSIGEELFTWGSNKNLNLGFVGGNDSAYPERVPLARPRSLLLEQARQKYGHLPGSEQKTDEELLDASILFDPIQVSDIQLSKFHTAVLTTDPHSNLFICGFGRGGRLGFGEEQDVQYTLRPLLAPLLPKKKVEVVALGQDHTVAVLEDGEVFTWGSNTHGQLGYAVPQKHAREEPIQATPRQVFGLIKREPIIGAAASRVHTAVFTRDSLYTWGKNDGQLGILDSSDTATLEIQTTPRKVSANFLTGHARIRDVVAVDKATVILLESREVWILAGGGYSRISFPVDDGFQLSGSGGSRFTTTPRYGGDAQGNKIDKISGGGDTVAFLSDVGAVFALDVDAVLKERISRAGGKVSSSWQSHRVWSLRKRHMAVRDFDVGADGNIIICTQSGSVWRRVKRVKLKESGNAGGDGSRYKFTRIPGLTRVTTVRSNTAGAFAAVRQDCSLLRTSVKVDPPTLWEDIGNLMPLMGIFKKHQEVAMPPLVKSDENWEQGYHNLGPIPKPEWFEGAYCWFMEGDHEGDLRDHLKNFWIQGLGDLGDVLIATDKHPDLRIPVHSCILARSPVLRSFLSRPNEATMEGLLTLSGPADSGNRTLILHSINLLTLLNILYYLYLDTLIDLWHQRSLPKPIEALYKSLRSEMLLLATKLELSHLQEAVGRMHYPHRSLDADLLLLLQDSSYLKATADLVLECQDGDIMVHSAVMRARCPFFETLYKGEAKGRWLEGRKKAGRVRVDMRHVGKEVMGMVVSWVYKDWEADGKGQGFEGCKAGVQEGDVDEWLDFVVGVMEVADEVLVGRLQQVCQKVLGRYVTLRNIGGLLVDTALCSERGFKQIALEYCMVNLESLVETRLLDDLDSDLMADLDRTVQNVQKRIFSYARNNVQLTLLADKYPDMAADSEEELRRWIGHYTITAENHHHAQKQHGGQQAAPTSPGSPKHKSARRKGSKAQLGPTGGDDIFAMDDDPSLSPTSPGATPQLSDTPITPGEHRGKGKKIWADLPLASTPPLFSLTPPLPTPTPTRNPSAPWMNAATPGSNKLDMKEIMAQAETTAGAKSSLTAALVGTPPKTPVKAHAKLAGPSTPGGGSSRTPLTPGTPGASGVAGPPPVFATSPFAASPAPAPKHISQKERKRQQLLQAEAERAAAEAAERERLRMEEEERNRPVWGVPVGKKVERVNLKDVLGVSSAGSASSAAPAAGNGRVAFASGITNGLGARSGVVAQQNARQNSLAAAGASSVVGQQNGVGGNASSARHAAPTTPSKSRPLPAASSSVTASPSATASSSRPIPVKSTTTPIASSSSSVPRTPPVATPRKPVEYLPLSLQDIIDQEVAQKEMMKEYQCKRSLQEIQEEQEFLRWWDEEQKRMRGEDEATEALLDEARREMEGGGNRGRGGKRKGRGRGGGEGGERGGKNSGHQKQGSTGGGEPSSAVNGGGEGSGRGGGNRGRGRGGKKESGRGRGGGGGGASRGRGGAVAAAGTA